MGPRAIVATGLVSGAIVAALGLLGAVAFLPDPAAQASPSAGSPAASGGPGANPSGSAKTGGSAEPAAVASIGVTLFHVGEPAPPLRLPQVGGGEISLASLAGKPLWINFMQTTCPACVDEFPLMNGFAARYADTGLVVVAIDIREDEGTVAAFAQSLNAIFPIGLDADGAAATAWDVAALPVHFWVDRDGIIRAGALGGIGPDTMAENLSQILPGVTVTP